MGIVNGEAPDGEIDRRQPSLLLMGIVNLCPALSARMSCRSSLLLMGIVNGPHSSPRTGGPVPLITPHGNCKPDIPGVFDYLRVHLITPHGNCKQLEGLSFYVRESSSHYSSWEL